VKVEVDGMMSFISDEERRSELSILNNLTVPAERKTRATDKVMIKILLIGGGRKETFLSSDGGRRGSLSKHGFSIVGSADAVLLCVL